MHFILAGGSGFIGLQLCSELLLEQHKITILTHSELHEILPFFTRRGLQDDVEIIPYDQYQGEGDVLINLAGASLGAKPVMTRRLKLLRQSRISVIEKFAALPSLPPIYMQASAVAVYPDSPETQDEASLPEASNDIASMALDVEAAQDLLANFEIERFYTLRFGLVLDNSGGLMRKLRKAPPFTVIHGDNYIPYISLDDAVSAIVFLSDPNTHVKSGPVNIVAPQKATLKEVLHCCYQHSRIPPVPIMTGLLKLGDKRSQILRANVDIAPQALLDAGFTFSAPRIELIE